MVAGDVMPSDWGLRGLKALELDGGRCGNDNFNATVSCLLVNG